MPFEKGVSGNPRGPKPGSGPVQKLRKAIEKDLPSILAAMTEAAKAGDTSAARLLVDKVLPNVKPESRPLPPSAPVDPAGILEAIAQGVITVEQAAALMGILSDKAAIGAKLEDGARLKRIEVLLRRPGELDRKL